MQRTRRRRSNKCVSAVFVSDIHLTDTTPVSRTDDYIQAQEKKLAYIQELADKHQCPIICAGDVFHHWKSSPWLLAWACKHLPLPMVTIPGNHDLPMHSLDQYERSSLHVLDTALDQLHVLLSNPATYDICGRKIVILHELIWPTSHASMASMVGGRTAAEVLREYAGEFDVVITGDNHMPFVEEFKGTILVNPGSMMRSTADQIDHRPRCYVYYAEDNTVEPVYLPIQHGVISRQHIDKVKERDARIAAYIERMQSNSKVTLSFRQNLEAFLKKNNISEEVEQEIWRYYEE